MQSKMSMIEAAIRDPKIRVVSFDVFDTLIVRPFWTPADLFLFLDKRASELLNTVDVINFSSYRKACEAEAREQSSAEDVTLSEIYACIQNHSPFSKEVTCALMEYEKELEMRFCMARNSAAELFQLARRYDKTVIVVSDMYLPGDFVCSILKKNGIEPDYVFVSGDLGVTKGSGNLFRYVSSKIGIDYSAIVHIGDNRKTDVSVPGKLGIQTFHYPRTINLMKKTGYKRAYEQIRSSISNFHAMEELGIRCMLAISANRIFDDPFKSVSLEDTLGNIVLGMYCMAQGLWVLNKAKSKDYNEVLFFSRDGYLPYLAYDFLAKYIICPAAAYVRSSRKALLPLLLTHPTGPLKIGSHLLYYDHSPKSVTRIMGRVLTENAEAELEKEKTAGWSDAFFSETEMVDFVSHLYQKYLDQEKADSLRAGFTEYFSAFMNGRVLTYDIGYSLRNEIFLREFFPDVEVDACFTHCGDDVLLRRGMQGGIEMNSFYSSTPYVSWLPRELFLTEDFPSCVGYEKDGTLVFEEKKDSETIIGEIQKIAISYMNDFVKIFQKEAVWLPMQPSNACLGMEMFLHSPVPAERNLVRNINPDNTAASGLRSFDCFHFWQRLRLDYWAANHHFGKIGRYMIMFFFLLATDRQDLHKAIAKRVPYKLRKIYEK